MVVREHWAQHGPGSVPASRGEEPGSQQDRDPLPALPNPCDPLVPPAALMTPPVAAAGRAPPTRGPRKKGW